MRLGYLMPLTVQNIATARRLGYDTLEANVGWLNRPVLEELERDLGPVKEALAGEQIGVSAVAVYGDAVTTPADEAIGYYRRAMDVARALGSSVVAGMTGRNSALSIDENIPLFKERFGPIAQMAADSGVSVAFEPWPGRVTGYGPYAWANMAVAPELYDRLFEAVPGPALGIEFDASHYAWQGIDYTQLLRDYRERIHHVHAKDIVIDSARLKRTGVHGAGWWRFVLPGLGQLDWPALLATLHEVGYRGDMAVEHEDQVYYGERWNEGLLLGLKTLRPLIEELWPD